MVMPNFLIIGAAKAGTTSLHYYLNQHPQIYMSSVKEPRFFALEGETLDFRNPDQGINQTSVTSLEAYCNLFHGVTNEIAIGEASPLYLYSRKAAERIKHYIPQAKLIVVLRDPVERAFSCYTHLVREGYENGSFAEGLHQEETRIRDNWAHLWHYKHGGFYYAQLKHYFELFDRDQIKVYLYEDLNRDSVAVAQDIFEFLNVDQTFVPDLTRMNVSGVPKLQFLHDFFAKDNAIRTTLAPLFSDKLRQTLSRSIRKWNLGEKPSLSSELRQQLIEVYRDDVKQLEHLLQRDLSRWLAA